MIPLTITNDLDANPWRDLEDEAKTRNIEGRLERIGFMRDGTRDGHPVVWMKVVGPDGKAFVVQTTWRLFHTAHDAMRAGNVDDCARAEA